MNLLGGAWNGKKIDAAQARKEGVIFDDLLRAASTIARSNKDVECRLRLWLADCAARVLHIYEKQHPNDDRPRNAIIAARKLARGEIGAAAGAAEEAWQFDRLVARLSDKEPDDYPLPKKARAAA